MHGFEHEVISIIGIREFVEAPFCRTLCAGLVPPPAVARTQWQLGSKGGDQE